MPDFEPRPTSKPRPGMVLCVTKNKVTRFLRVTHVFDDCVYAMWVGEPNEARTARRPRKFTLSELDRMKNRKAAWGQLRLPPDLLDVPDKGSLRWTTLEHLWNLIKPLIVKVIPPFLFPCDSVRALPVCNDFA